MIRKTLSIAFAAACALATGAAAGADSARYDVTFERTWSSQTHPKDFPLLAHFSPVIGLTHHGVYDPFKAGATASAGVEKLCEEGKHQPLDAEIKAAIERGEAGVLIETPDPIRSVPGKAMTSFQADSGHPMVSIAAMIAPSPDWCAIASGVSLQENGAWVASKTVELYAWDAGTDSAMEYRARDADMQPRGPIQLSELPFFSQKGKHIPVGTVTFTRK